MPVRLNGEPRDLATPTTVTALLADLGIDARLVAVEVNRTVIKRARYADTVIKDGDEVEIVAFVGGGTTPNSGRRASKGRGPLMMRSIFIAGVVALAGAAVLRAQTPASSPEPALIAQGYTLLARGDGAGAATIGAQALSASPRSTAALTLLIDAESARAGALSALGSYESWLGDRKIEDAYVLRRVARAVLREALVDRQHPDERIEAAKALGADGDANALAVLNAGAQQGNSLDTKVLAALGDERAINALITQLKAAKTKKAALIEALAASRSPLAIAPIMAVLDDPDLDNRASAADALGRLGATAATPALRKLLDDNAPGPIFHQRFEAAAALTRFGDSAGIVYLQGVLESDVARDPKNTYLRAEILEALAPHPDLQWQNDVRALVADPDPLVRVIVAKLLAPYDNPGAEAMLNRLLGDDNPGIRNLAADTLVSQVATGFATLRGLLHQAGPTRVRAAGRILELTR